VGIGCWVWEIGDWGLGILPNPQSTIPNPQSPIPNPHSKMSINEKKLIILKKNNFKAKKIVKQNFEEINLIFFYISFIQI